MKIQLLLALLATLGLAELALAADAVSFRSQIAPVLIDNCVACHGAKKAEGGYRIDTFEYLMRAGDSGASPVTASKLEESEVWQRVISKDHDLRMPADSEPLSAAEVELLKSWISSGAAFDGASKSESLLMVVPPPTYPEPPAKYPAALPVTSLAFSADGSQVISGGYHELLCWNAADGKLARRIKNVGERSYAIAVSPDGKHLAIAGGSPGKLGEVRIFDFASGNLVAVCARSTDVVLDVAYSPDGTRLATGGADGLIRILESATGKEIRTIASHADWVNAIAWSDDGKRLASVSRDKSAKVYTAETGELLNSYAGHAAPVKGVAFAPDGLQVLSVGDDKKLHRWEVETAKKVAEVSVGGDGYKLVRKTNLVFAPTTDKLVHRIDLTNNQDSLKYAGQQDWVLAVAMHAGVNHVASGAINGEIKLWELAESNPLRSWLATP